MNEFRNGLKDGIPIALGYFAVSFSFGILAIKGGLSVFQAVLTSVTNVTSAGQFAGLQIIIAGGTILEVILTQLIINLRYGLMSLSLTQKLADDVGIWKRLIIAFANTDEIFAVAMGYFKEVTGCFQSLCAAHSVLHFMACSWRSLFRLPRSQNLCYLWYAWQLCSVSFYIMFRYSTLSRPEYRSLYVQ